MEITGSPEFSFSKQLIPIEICKWAFQNKKVNQLQTWVTLKLFFKGDFSHDDALDLFKSIETHGVSKHKKTIENHLKELKRLKFLRDWGKPTRGYIASGYDWVCDSMGFTGTSSAVLHLKDLPTFRYFIAAAVIGYHTNRFTIHKRQAGAVLIGDCNSTSSSFVQRGLSIDIIKQLLNVSKGRASVIKSQCKDLGYLTVKHQFRQVSLDSFEPTKTNLRGIREFSGYKLKIVNGKWVEQIHDSIIPKVEFRRRRKVKMRKKTKP